MHRRQFIYAATLAGVSLPLAGLPTLAQSTPIPAGDGTLPGRVASVEPEILLEALLTTPVTTPLVPRDTPEVGPLLWDDASDSDLEGTLGGVLFGVGSDADDAEFVIATAIVHPDADAAAAVFDEVGPAETQQLFGMPWFVQAFDDYAISVVQISYLLLAGGADAPEDEPLVAGGATPTAEPTRVPRLDLRAVSYMTAMLDHLEDVLAALDA